MQEKKYIRGHGENGEPREHELTMHQSCVGCGRATRSCVNRHIVVETFRNNRSSIMGINSDNFLQKRDIRTTFI